MEGAVSAPLICVVGGINMDVGASPAAQLKLRDSNPGSVRLRPGGVGRNIAHNLRLLGCRVRLACALGEDLFARGLRQSCEDLGIDLSLALTVPGRASSSYLYVTERGGEMLCGVADMAITDSLTPEVLGPLLPELDRADAVVLDANLSAEAIAFLAENCRAPLYGDPVSGAKAPRMGPVLRRFACLKPNALEAEALTGEKDPERAARALREAGVRRVFVSLGAGGMLAAEGDTLLRLPCFPCRVRNTTGAGDAAMAAAVWAGVRGLPLRQAAEAALRAGAQTAAVEETNAPALTI